MSAPQRQVKPLQVFKNVNQMMNKRIAPKVQVRRPPWYNAIESHPPSEILTRTYPQQHQPRKIVGRKASKLFQPQRLYFEEDSLRRQFYKDHPWELARPRMVLEMDGKDYQRYDWSKGLRQPGMPLCGESVVQRQMWMMYNVPGMTRDKAYDATRREFYQMRQEEEVERRIAQEEARAVGAYFGKGFLQVGMELEDKEVESWKKWAGKQIDAIRVEKNSAYTNYGEEEEAAIDPDDVAEEETSGSAPAEGR